MERWTWVLGYAVVVIIALVLGGVLGEMVMFKQATLGTPKLTAAGIAKFISYGGAMWLLWLSGRRASDQLHEQGGRTAFLADIVVPLVTLMVASGAYYALLYILKPFLDAGLRNLYNWVFVLVIAGSAVWSATAVFHHAQALVELLRPRARR